MKKTLLTLALVAACLGASAQDTCQFNISRHSSISCQFGVHTQRHVYVERYEYPPPAVIYQYPQVPAWTQAPVFQQPPPQVIYVQPEPQVIYVQPRVYVAPGMHIPNLPYQPNPYLPYYHPYPYARDHKHRPH